MAQLVKCLPYKPKDPSSIPSTYRDMLCVVTHSYNPSTGEAEIRGSLRESISKEADGSPVDDA